MIYSHKYKYIYLAPAKTGTRTMDETLTEHFDGSYWNFTGITLVRKDKNDQRKRLRWPRHIVHVPEEISDYFIFATIRNPYFYLLSQYKHWAKRKMQIEPCMSGFMEFIEFIPNLEHQSLFRRLKRHKSYIPPPKCVPFEINQFLKTENLEEDFNSLPFVKNPMKLPKLNENNAQLGYTKKMAEMLLKHRKMDFEYFGFDTKIPSELRYPCLL